MINSKKKDIHPHLLINHGDDINTPPAEGYEQFGLQNVNGIARGHAMGAFNVIQATEELHLGIF